MNYSSLTSVQKKILGVFVFSTFTGAFGLWMIQRVTSNRYINMPYTQASLEILKEYPPVAEKYIGTKINPGKIPILLRRDPFCKIHPDDTRLTFNVYGEKGMGKLYLWARRKYAYDDFCKKEEWLIRRLDIQVFVNDVSKRWKFYETEPVPEFVSQSKTSTSAIAEDTKKIELNTEGVDSSDPMLWVKTKIK